MRGDRERRGCSANHRHMSTPSDQAYRELFDDEQVSHCLKVPPLFGGRSRLTVGVTVVVTFLYLKFTSITLSYLLPAPYRAHTYHLPSYLPLPRLSTLLIAHTTAAIPSQTKRCFAGRIDLYIGPVTSWPLSLLSASFLPPPCR